MDKTYIILVTQGLFKKSCQLFIVFNYKYFVLHYHMAFPSLIILPTTSLDFTENRIICISFYGKFSTYVIGY